MSIFILVVFVIAAVIAIASYQVGYKNGHRAAHCLNATTGIASLRKAVQDATASLNNARGVPASSVDFSEITEAISTMAEEVKEKIDDIEPYVRVTKEKVEGVALSLDIMDDYNASILSELLYRASKIGVHAGDLVDYFKEVMPEEWNDKQDNLFSGWDFESRDVGCLLETERQYAIASNIANLTGQDNEAFIKEWNIKSAEIHKKYFAGHPIGTELHGE